MYYINYNTGAGNTSAETLYKYGKPLEVEEYPSIETGIEAEMSHKESSALFLVGDELWSLDRVTPYGLTELINQGFKQFDSDIVGITTGYSNAPLTVDVMINRSMTAKEIMSAAGYDINDNVLDGFQRGNQWKCSKKIISRYINNLCLLK